MPKYNTKDVIKILNKSGYELINGEYIDSFKKITLKDKEEYYYFLTFSAYIKYKSDGNKHSKFSTYNPYTTQNIKLWCKLNNKPFELVSIYDNAKEKLKWQCLKDDCREIFEMNWGDVSSGRGCPYCAGRQVGLSNCLATKNANLASEWHPTLNGDLTPWDVTVCSGKYAYWLCKECGHEWETIIANRTNVHSDCPVCNQSKGEKRIKEWLDLNNVIYKSQKEFKGLLGLRNGNLSYDFYLPQYNLLIEYQGEQHKRYRKGFHKTIEDFEKQIEHDKRKKEYAEENGYNFLEIWYFNINKVDKILTNLIKGV